MTLRNILPFTLTASLLVAAGSTTMLLADDPGNTGCTQTRASCWDEVFCAWVSECLSHHTTEQGFYTCLIEQAIDSYMDCAQRICADSFVTNQTAPTNQQCIDMYKDRRDKYCEFTSPSPSSRLCERFPYEYQPDGADSGVWVDRIKDACKKAAWQEYVACRARAISNTSPTSFYDATVMSGAAESGYWQPSEGIFSASFVLVPLDDTTSRVTHAVVSSLLWTGERWERVVLGEFERGADMLTEVQVDLRSIPEASYGSDLDLLVEWMEGDEFLAAFDHFLPIHESANPGDFNRDGERNAADLSAFIDAYDHNAPRADRNGDGVVNAEDLALFLAEYDGS